VKGALDPRSSNVGLLAACGPNESTVLASVGSWKKRIRNTASAAKVYQGARSWSRVEQGRMAAGGIVTLAWLKLRRREQRRTVQRIGRRVRVSVEHCQFEFDLAELHDFLVYRAVARRGLYEPTSTRLVLSSLRPGDTFLDIGANNGWYALLAAHVVGSTGHVLAFEPNPLAFDRLSKNLDINGNPPWLSPLRIALSDASGERDLYVPDLSDGLGSILGSLSRPGHAIKVQCSTLDAALSNNRVDIVKLDVEGAELQVLDGMPLILAHNPQLRILVEWNSLSGSELINSLLARFDVARVIERSTRSSLTPVLSYRDVAKLKLCNLWCQPKRVVS
jgi:FkbM family methyltransferase